ncbi:putative uncharacterized oxidoreductase YDR541C [Anneissia japonica]|uniref:putative uncharacterized oxidoreductase YDR541C n=1 Tax=Anneissia japonica TaxID=1529436 RepID=UPI0014256910|nr:putative uncharacterized oxidoreductase YDR541C [Anneissia japonica]
MIDMASNDADGVTRVLVTGASGYLGAHVVKQLQEAGHRVRGTVRSTKNEQKIKPLKELCPNAAYELELVEADLQKEDGWESAVADCSHVMHVASPFPASNPANEDEVIRPAVDGTMVVLKAAVAAKVKRVVLTSSLVAITSFSKSRSVSEEDWNTGTKESAYNKSKTMAEKAAWDYINGLPDDSKIELAVINPSLIIGPYLTNTKGTSASMVSQMLNREMSLLPAINFPCVDVRNVAAAHVRAMTYDTVVGKRHIMATKNMSMQDVSIVLAAEFKPQGYNPPTKAAPNFFMRIVALFNSEVKGLLGSLGVVITADNTRMKDVLKIDPIPVEESLIEMGYSVIEKGWVKKTSNYKGRPQEAAEAAGEASSQE